MLPPMLYWFQKILQVQESIEHDNKDLKGDTSSK